MRSRMAGCLAALVLMFALAPFAAAQALPDAGGLTALPKETTEGVPLLNPGFEQTCLSCFPVFVILFDA